MSHSIFNDPPAEQWHLTTFSLFGGMTLLTVGLLTALAYGARLGWLSMAFGRFARAVGRRRMVLICGLFGFAVTMCVGLLVHMPQPRIHDEYSYLLAGDTFAHGRLTNPTPLFWRHFETIHELMRPSYASKYPPGQGIMLALGEVLGNPAIGLWVSAGLACASVCWMLMAFFPSRWAFLGGLLTALHPMVLKWTQNYWGGLVAMIGGLLLIGAGRRLVEPGARRRDAMIFAIGIAILANSRPWEGAILALLVISTLLPRLLRTRPAVEVLRRVVVPAALVLSLTFAWMGYYNYRVTGKAMRMPYVEHEAQYWVAPTLMFLPIRPVPSTLTAESMKGVAVTWAVRSYQVQHTPWGFVDASARKVISNLRGSFLLFDMSADDLDPPTELPWWLLGFRWILLIPIAAALCRWRVDPSVRWAAGVAGVFSILVLTDTWMHPHYAAPAAGLVAILVVAGLRGLSSPRAWVVRAGGGRGYGHVESASIGEGRSACSPSRPENSLTSRRVWRGMSTLIALCFVGSFAAACVQFRSPDWVRGNGAAREVVIDYLKRQGPWNLVLVRYGDGYQVNGEWLYNDADIDNSPIIWARELDPASNMQLLEYYRRRRPWLLLLDKTGAHLYPISLGRSS